MLKAPRGIDALVEEQVRRWQLERQRKKALEQPPPIITMSRQFGARGAELAGVVAGRLGYQLWDRAILTEIARHADAPDVLFKSLDEHRRNIIAETLGTVAPGGGPTANDYHVELERVLHTISGHGKAVVVGRGAQYLLPADRTLRVRAVCSRDRRIAQVAQRRGINASEAAEIVAEADSDRADFALEHYQRNIEDPAAYDLIVNTGTLSMQQAADVVVAALRARFGEP